MKGQRLWELIEETDFEESIRGRLDMKKATADEMIEALDGQNKKFIIDEHLSWIKAKIDSDDIEQILDILEIEVKEKEWDEDYRPPMMLGFEKEEGKPEVRTETEFIVSKETKREVRKLRKDLKIDKLMKDIKNVNKGKTTIISDMYCLACGRLVQKGYKGECWDSMCHCLGYDVRAKDNHAAHTKCIHIKSGKRKGEWDILLSTSLVLSNFNFKKCKECKTLAEHKKKTVAQYLGQDWKKIKLENKEIVKIRDEFVRILQDRCETDKEKEK